MLRCRAGFRVFPNFMRAVLFDIDGTLIRTGGAGIRAFARTSELAFGLPGGTEGLVFHGRTDTSLVNEFLTRHRLPVTEGNRTLFLDTYLFLLAEMLANHPGERCPGVADFLQECRAIGPAPVLGLLTGNVRLGAELKLRAHGLWGEFELGGFGDDHEDRDRIAAVAKSRVERRIGEEIDGWDILVVGDTPRDVACARAIGARCLAVATGGIAAEELAASGPDWLVEDLREISAVEVCSHARNGRPSGHKSMSNRFLV